MKRHLTLAAITSLAGLVAAANTNGACGGIAIATDDAGPGIGTSGRSSSGASSASSGASGASASSSGASSGGSGASGSSSGASGSSGTSGSSSGTSGGTPGCPTAGNINASVLPWKPPLSSPGSCTQAEAAALVGYVDMNPNATLADMKASVANATCRDCIFGDDTKTTWTPIFEDAKGATKIDVGGCIAIASGSESCGKSYQQWYECRFEACAGCPPNDDVALVKCLATASKAACKSAFDAVSTICGDQAIGDAETACSGDKYIFEAPVKAQCVGGVP